MKNPNQKIKNQYVIIHNKNQNKNFYNMISPNKIKKIKANKTEENLIKDYFINKNTNKKIINDYSNKTDYNIYYSSEKDYNEKKDFIEDQINQNYENESGSERLHQIKDNYIEYLQKQLDKNNKNLIKYEKKINEFSKRYKNLIEDNKLLNETLNERTSKLNEIIQENDNLKMQLNNNIENENQIKIYYDKKIKEYEEKIKECNSIINNLKENKNENCLINNDMNKSSDNLINNNEKIDDELNLIKNQNLIYLNNLKSKDNTIELMTKENEKLLKENKEYKKQIENLNSTIKEKNDIINVLKNKEGILATDNIIKNENKKNEDLKICYSQENISFNFLSNNINNNKVKNISSDNYKEEIVNSSFNIINNKNNEKINQSIDKLIFDNEENKMKIEMLNNKLKSFDDFEKKYFEFINNNKNEKNNQAHNHDIEKNFRYLNLINDNNETNIKKEIINDYKLDENEKNLNDDEKEKDLFNDISNENLDLKSYKKYKAKDNKENDELILKNENDEEESKKKEENDNKKKEEKEIEKVNKEEKEKEEKEEKKEIKKYRYGFMYRRRLMKEKSEKEKKEKEEKEREEKEKKEEKDIYNKDEEKKTEKEEINKHGMKEKLKDEKYEIKETVREMNRKRNYTHNPKSKKRFKISDELDVTEINTSSPVVPQNLSFSVEDKNNNIENMYLFGIDRNDLLHIFDVRKKRWSKKKILEIEDISDTFQKDYQYEGTILYNTLSGLFILTGKKLDVLYYYNAQNETINKICKFNNSHDNGSLMLEKEYNRLFVFGGKNTISCEYYSFNDKKVNIIPDLNKERANASFVSCNDKIFAFFGFSYEKNKYSESIEYIDNKKLDKWYELKDINILNKEVTFDVESISTIPMNDNKDKILIYAGIKGENEDFIVNNYYIFDTKENAIDIINKWSSKMFRFTGTRWRNYILSKRDPAGFHFAKNSNFLEIPKGIEIDGYENENGINLLIDYKNNVHFVNQEKKTIDIFKGDI